AEVKSILKSQCFKCHSPEEKRANLDMTNYGSLMRGSTSGPVIVKGDPDESLLYLLVTHQEEPRMPPGSPKMPDDRLEVIRRWIAAGAPERPEDVPPSVASATAPAPAVAVKSLTTKPVRPTSLTALAASRDGSLLAVSDQSRAVLFESDSQGWKPRAA